MRFRALWLTLAAAIMLSGCSGGQSTKPVMLRLKAKVGDAFVLNYRVDTEYDLPGDGKGGPPSKETSYVELKKQYTCKAATDEKITWEVKTISVEADGTGPMKSQSYTVIDSEKDKVETVERDGQNKLLSKTRENPLEMIYPDSEVNVGDAWRGNLNLQGNSLMLTYTIDGFEKIGGRDTVRIKGALAGDLQVRLSKPLMVWIDTANGFPVKGDGQFLIEPQSGIKVRMSVKMTVS